jgi:hypothetical protein
MVVVAMWLVTVAAVFYLVEAANKQVEVPIGS